jgi:mono/diheme cytochrome c family protein
LAAVGLLLLGLSFLSGCGSNAYPEDLEYPVRSGVLLIAAPTPANPPVSFEPPGELNFILDALDDTEKSKTYNLNDPKYMTPEDRDQYQLALNKLFGTPAVPLVSAIDDKTRAELKLDPETLAEGSRHCLHCHGLTGDGHGPTAPWVNPHPRDYRRGIFKFSSSSQPYGEVRKPRRDDLRRTLEEGIDGTSMPSFRLLPSNEPEALISYVMHLSIRGQAEFRTLRDQLTIGLDEGVEQALTKNTKSVAKFWWDASFAREDGKLRYLIQPGSYPKYDSEQKRLASVRKGFQLFVTSGPSSASCISCHKDYGRQSPLSFDEWGTIIRPADLTLGLYRGGRRPVDFYYRIHSGINGSGMTAFGSTLSSEEIWDLVNFVQALPYPQMLPPDLRARVYGEP